MHRICTSQTWIKAPFSILQMCSVRNKWNGRLSSMFHARNSIISFCQSFSSEVKNCNCLMCANVKSTRHWVADSRVQLKCDGTTVTQEEEKWRGNWRMEWVASILHTTTEHGVSSITTADVHISAASSRLNWRPRQFKWTPPFRLKTKSGFCARTITLQTQSTIPILVL